MSSITIDINTYISKIVSLCPKKYSPFNSEGRGSQGYLFEISDELGDYLLRITKEYNKKISIKNDMVADSNSNYEVNRQSSKLQKTSYGAKVINIKEVKSISNEKGKSEIVGRILKLFKNAFSFNI